MYKLWGGFKIAEKVFFFEKSQSLVSGNMMAPGFLTQNLKITLQQYLSGME